MSRRSTSPGAVANPPETEAGDCQSGDEVDRGLAPLERPVPVRGLVGHNLVVRGAEFRHAIRKCVVDVAGCHDPYAGTRSWRRPAAVAGEGQSWARGRHRRGAKPVSRVVDDV